MSSPKFMVFKLKDLRIPALIVLIAVALFLFFMFKNKATQTFAPSNGYEDGKYIAGITLTDAEMDVVVEVTNHNISSISLSGLDETSSTLYSDLVDSIDYVNTYVTTTQSLELPKNGNVKTATLLLMDAIKIALSDNANASVTNTYERVLFSSPQDTTAKNSTAVSEPTNTGDDIFVDEFSDDDFNADSTPTLNMDTDTLKTNTDALLPDAE